MILVTGRELPDLQRAMPRLDLSGMPVAIANVLPALKANASLVPAGVRGAGVAELIDRLIATDLAEVDARSACQRVALLRTEGDTLGFLPPRGSIKDLELAAEAEAIERGPAPPDEARQLLHEAIGRRYTLPA